MRSLISPPIDRESEREHHQFGLNPAELNGWSPHRRLMEDMLAVPGNTYGLSRNTDTGDCPTSPITILRFLRDHLGVVPNPRGPLIFPPIHTLRSVQNVQNIDGGVCGDEEAEVEVFKPLDAIWIQVTQSIDMFGSILEELETVDEQLKHHTKQVVVLSIIPRMEGSRISLNTENLLKYVVLFQFVPRVLRVHPLYKEATITSGMFTVTAWSGAAFNLFLYMLASHVWYEYWLIVIAVNECSLGQNLKTSTFFGEILLAMLVLLSGVLYFSFLIAEIQKFLQPQYKTMGLEERRVKMREVEQWMSTRSLPASLRERIKQYEQYKWQKTRGVDEENLISNLPKDLRRDIKRHLGLDRLKRVPVFQRMDEQLLDALCGHLEQVFYTEGSFVMQEGKPVDAMLFVMDGKLASWTANGGSIGFFSMEYLERGHFGGEELLGWALDPHSSTKLPFSTRTVKALSEVEALVLKADDLKIVASEFRWSHDKQLRHFFRFYSQQWRTWAACFIQAAWRQYRQNKLEESLRIKEANRLQDASARGGGSLPSLGAITYVVRFAVNAIRAVRRNGSALTPCRLPERIFPTMIQKPAEPDFIAEDEETAAESDSTEFGVAFEEGSKGKYAASSSEVPGLLVQARSHRKRSHAKDERYDKLSTQLEETKTKLEEIALAIKKLTDDRLNVNDLYEEVMKTEGFDEPTLALAFDHLVENEKVAKAFMVKNARLRRACWKGTDGGRHFPKQNRDVSVSQSTLGLSGGFPDDGDRRRGGEELRRGTNQDEIGARDSRLREIDDRTLVAINGNQFRMGDLVATSSHNSKGNAIGSDLVNKTRGVVLWDTEGSEIELGPQPVSTHTQQPSHGALKNSVLKLGHEVSSGPGLLLKSQEVDMGTENNELIGLDQLVDIQIFNAPAKESIRSNKGVPGQKRGSIGKKGKVGVGLQRSWSQDSQAKEQWLGQETTGRWRHGQQGSFWR
ncbi:hypothetical protein RHGRI_016131 [Rhododendron griersonianum]|uniref:Cyclic nucleotide-binding domain-containing protein n=1 Tax=Rhododendron griersonianum TaxID=479676 RepID=A0AAV6JSR0_9ERIC|nr:hypothetical protein RHGRI_016131 [Rhododendron griersonianum]